MKKGGIDTAIGHWAQLMEGLQESPQHFYESVTAAIERREIPDCRLTWVWWREGGAFSAQRKYLRAKRAGYHIDICGAPFGNAFFASSWLCVPPPSLFVGIVLTMLGCIIGFFLTMELVSVAKIALVPGVLNEYWRGRLMEQSAWLGLDVLGTLLVFIFGMIRPLFFPPRLTFYRYDTAQMFYAAVHEAVREVIDGLRSAQGLRALSEEEWKPIMRGLGR